LGSANQQVGDGGGENAANILSLIESAKLKGVNPQTWLTDVLTRINDHMINRIDELLPGHWQKPGAAPGVATAE
jgi:transposase